MSADHLDTSAQGCSSILSFESPRLSSLNNEIIRSQIPVRTEGIPTFTGFLLAVSSIKTVLL